MSKQFLINACLAEGWSVDQEQSTIEVNGVTLPLAHPYQVHLKFYKDAIAPEEKLHHMKMAHDHLWPDMVITNNYWQDDMFRAHCEGWIHVILAGGAGLGKSMTIAKVALLWWLALPRQRAVVISSTTLDSLETRIWGYVVKLIQETKFPIPAKVIGGKPPKVMYPGSKDKIHGMFATAIREGDTERTLSTLIGRHPDDGLMVVLDECTDISSNIVKALPNLEQGVPFFQLFGIGNSSDKNDLHGSLATPKDGWESVDPEKDKSWRTTHKNGICLYFNPWNSPAIHEEDPIKRAALERFLINREGIIAKQLQYGTESDAYYRFVLGFWRSKAMDKVILSREFLKEARAQDRAEWSGMYPLSVVAGLDPAIASGKKGCVLRLALVGHATNGQMVIDFMYDDLMFYIDINPKMEGSAELQLADQVLAVLQKYNCQIYYLALDATGLGRALGELLKLKSGSQLDPMRVVSTRGFGSSAKDESLITMPPIDIWANFRNYVQHKQIRGLDDLTMAQIVNRKLLEKNGKQTLEQKSDYMNRMAAIDPKLAHSPNEVDATVLCVLAASYRLGLKFGEVRQITNQTRFDEKYMVFINNQAAKRAEAERLSPQKPVIEASFSNSVEDIIWKAN